MDIYYERIMCEKLKQLYSDLKKCTPGNLAENEEFREYSGWFYKFRKRTAIHVLMHMEVTSANVR